MNLFNTWHECFSLCECKCHAILVAVLQENNRKNLGSAQQAPCYQVQATRGKKEPSWNVRASSRISWSRWRLEFTDPTLCSNVVSKWCTFNCSMACTGCWLHPCCSIENSTQIYQKLFLSLILMTLMLQTEIRPTESTKRFNRMLTTWGQAVLTAAKLTMHLKICSTRPVVVLSRLRLHVARYMLFAFSTPCQVTIGMTNCIANMVDECSVTFFGKNNNAPSPAGKNLVTIKEDSPLLPRGCKEEFHMIVAKGLFVCRCARPDLHPRNAVLCTRVRSPTEDNWSKLMQLLCYCNWTHNNKLILQADNLQVVKGYVDALFAVHPNFKSHTGVVMMYGSGAIKTMERKQKLNTHSSTKVELVGDDAMTMILWSHLFLWAQGCNVQETLLYQDNKSMILLASNGKRSSTKRTRAITIHYFL